MITARVRRAGSCFADERRPIGRQHGFGQGERLQAGKAPIDRSHEGAGDNRDGKENRRKEHQ